LTDAKAELKIFSMLSVNCAFLLQTVWQQTTLTRELKLNVFGAERLFTQVRKNPASAIMGE
jgi:hypothetical protein